MTDKKNADTGISDDAEVPEIKDVTLLFFIGGLQAQVLGNITSRVTKARREKTGFIKATGLKGEHDVYLDVSAIQMMEVTTATIRKIASPSTEKPEFRQPNFPAS